VHDPPGCAEAHASAAALKRVAPGRSHAAGLTALTGDVEVNFLGDGGRVVGLGGHAAHGGGQLRAVGFVEFCLGGCGWGRGGGGRRGALVSAPRTPVCTAAYQGRAVLPAGWGSTADAFKPGAATHARWRRPLWCLCVRARPLLSAARPRFCPSQHSDAAPFCPMTLTLERPLLSGARARVLALCGRERFGTV
jgi:hypothetical protein